MASDKIREALEKIHQAAKISDPSSLTARMCNIAATAKRALASEGQEEHPEYGPCDAFGPNQTCSECTGLIQRDDGTVIASEGQESGERVLVPRKFDFDASEAAWKIWRERGHGHESFVQCINAYVSSAATPPQESAALPQSTQERVEQFERAELGGLTLNEFKAGVRPPVSSHSQERGEGDE